MQVPGATATEKQLLVKKTGDMGAGTGKKKLGSGSDLSKEEKIGEEVQYSGDQDVQHSTVQYSTVSTVQCCSVRGGPGPVCPPAGAVLAGPGAGHPPPLPLLRHQGGPGEQEPGARSQGAAISC